MCSGSIRIWGQRKRSRWNKEGIGWREKGNTLTNPNILITLSRLSPDASGLISKLSSRAKKGSGNTQSGRRSKKRTKKCKPILMKRGVIVKMHPASLLGVQYMSPNQYFVYHDDFALYLWVILLPHLRIDCFISRTVDFQQKNQFFFPLFFFVSSLLCSVIARISSYRTVIM